MEDSIYKNIAKGTFFMAVAKYSSTFVNIVVAAILARLLPPSSFGVIAVTTVFTSFFDLLSNMGFGPAIIQNKSLSRHEVSELFVFLSISAFIFSFSFFFLSNTISSFYEEEQLVSIFKWLSLQVLFVTLNVVPRSLLLKDKNFKSIAFVDIISCFVLGVAAVIAAFSGMGIYALIVQPIGSSLVSFILCMFLNRHVLLLPKYLSINTIRKVLSFSAYQFLFNMINFFSRNLDKLIIGKYLGMSQLGYYEKSYRLMTLPLSQFTSVINPSIQPVLSDYQNDKQVVFNSYCSISKLLLLIGAVITPLFFFAAEEIITIFFGKNWGEAVPIFQILSISIVTQLVDSLSGAFLQSLNSTKLLFWSGFLSAILNVLAILLGVVVYKNILITAALLSFALLLNYLLSVFCIVKIALRDSLSTYFRILLVPFLIIILISILCTPIYFYVHNLILSLILKLMVCLSITYFFSLYSGYMDIRKVFRNIIHSIIRR